MNRGRNGGPQSVDGFQDKIQNFARQLDRPVAAQGHEVFGLVGERLRQLETHRSSVAFDGVQAAVELVEIIAGLAGFDGEKGLFSVVECSGDVLIVQFPEFFFCVELGAHAASAGLHSFINWGTSRTR